MIDEMDAPTSHAWLGCLCHRPAPDPAADRTNPPGQLTARGAEGEGE